MALRAEDDTAGATAPCQNRARRAAAPAVGARARGAPDVRLNTARTCMLNGWVPWVWREGRGAGQVAGVATRVWLRQWSVEAACYPSRQPPWPLRLHPAPLRPTSHDNTSPAQQPHRYRCNRCASEPARELGVNTPPHLPRLVLRQASLALGATTEPPGQRPPHWQTLQSAAPFSTHTAQARATAAGS